VKIVVLTTSYPRGADDVAGVFVQNGVEALRAAGHDVIVVSPASFSHYGLAYGDGIPNNLKRRPWLAFTLPLFLLAYARAARRVAKGADVVHAHWLPSAIPALATRRQFVLQLWGSDVALAHYVRRPARALVRRAAVVVCASTALAEDARALGAFDVRVVPQGVDMPNEVPPPDNPPHALYVGRLSEEKGVRELADASRGLPLVVVGDGPLRSLFPEARGLVPRAELGDYYRRAALLVAPSRREGYGVAVREAMAHGRPVVATAVGGLRDAVHDGVTGLAVEPGSSHELREAMVRLLDDAELRSRLGAAARTYAEERLSWEHYVRRLGEAYETARSISRRR
jgi:glycosyltransferase involved in cell wall biosynthesis